MASKTPEKKKRKTEVITGYVSDVSPVKQPSSKGKKPFFEFKMTTEHEMLRSVCFSPEKRRLISSVEADKSKLTGCEISNFSKGDSGDILVNDFTSVRRCELKFEKPNLTLVYRSIAEILNELPMYSVVNVKGTVFSLAEKTAGKGSTLKLKSGSLKDDTETIPITIFGDLVTEVENDTGYRFTNMRISKYLHARVLKSTESTKIDIDESAKLEITATEKVENNSMERVEGIITAIEMKTFNTSYYCPNCKIELEPDNGMAICQNCDNLFSSDACTINNGVKFTLNTNTGNRSVLASLKILRDTFDPEEEAKNKMDLAKRMVRSSVKIILNNDDVVQMEIVDVED